MAMGRPKATLVFGFGTARTAGRHGQFAFSSGGTGESGQDYFAECFRQERTSRLRARWDDQRDGGQVAATIPGAGGVRIARRVAPRPPPPDQRRAGGPVGSQDAGNETAKTATHWSIRQIAAETRVSKSTVHRIWQAFGLAAASTETFQALERSIFRRKSTGYCRVVFESAGKCGGFVRG